MNDDICAIATPYGQGALAVLRASGTGAIERVNQIFKGKDLTKVPSHTVHYGNLVQEGQLVDEVMVSVFRAPRSYTTEDTVEITCHGGVFVSNQVLKALLKQGFRLAEPGEFTKRAFLNGRIDLTQAEAVMDVIGSQNKKALTVSHRALRKEIHDMIVALREQLLSLIAQIEVHIDYPEYDDAIEMTDALVLPILTAIRKQMLFILEQSQISQIVLSGVKTAIIGRPNVGKSSLLNMLLAEEKAIVSDIAGTTRDIVEGRLDLGPVTLHLIDTAGIRESVDFIETIGVQKAKEILQEAELVLLVLDQSTGLLLADLELLELTKNMTRIIIVNKHDLNQKIELAEEYVSISALHKQGLKELREKIIEILHIHELNDQSGNYLSNTRQVAKFEGALDSLNQAILASQRHDPIDMIELDLKQSWSMLGEIIGDTYTDSLLDELFSKFCLGK